MARFYRRDWRGRFAGTGGGSGRPMGGRSGSVVAVGTSRSNKSAGRPTRAGRAIQRRGATRYRAGSAIGGNKRKRYVSPVEASVGAIPGALRLPGISPAGAAGTVVGRIQSRRGATNISRGRKPTSGYIVTSDR